VSGSEDFVVLPGLILPLAPLLLALDLEHRGCRMELDGDILVIGPRTLLTDRDREQIRRWKLHLMAIVTYDANAQKVQ